MASDKKDMVDPWEKLGVRPTSIGMIPKVLDVVWAMPTRLTVCLVGETGIGKTPIVQQWATEKDGVVKMLNFGHMTQEEISMIMFTGDGESFDFIPPRWLVRLNEDAEESGCSVLFLDEWNRGDKALVNALFTLTDERRIHDFKLHDNVMVVAAMNPSDGVYLVNEAEKDHAIRKRLNFVYCVHDLQSFLDYTEKSRWHPTVPKFLKSAANLLYDQGARDAGKAFPCPSNWEKVSNIMESAEIQGIDLTSAVVRTLVDGQIGSVAANKYLDFVADENTLIQPSDIIYGYKPKSKVRKRIAALLGCIINNDGVFEEQVKLNRAGVVTDLNQAIAIELFREMPPMKKVAAHVARYIGDLPNDLLQVFTNEFLGKEARAKGNAGVAYLELLDETMQDLDGFRERLTEIFEARLAYKRKAGLVTGKDPAA